MEIVVDVFVIIRIVVGTDRQMKINLLSVVFVGVFCYRFCFSFFLMEHRRGSVNKEYVSLKVLRIYLSIIYGTKNIKP